MLRAAFHLLIAASSTSAAALQFGHPFGDGMILQRGTGTKIWGSGATPGSTVQVALEPPQQGSRAAAVADTAGNWAVEMPELVAAASTTVVASVATPASKIRLDHVAIGDVLLCGGQSNMGFGMCGSRSKNQTVQQALDELPPIRFFFQEGSGPYGGAGGRGNCKTTAGLPSITPPLQWFTANATNSGGASAVCMLTAAYLYESMEGKVPVGAIESCVGGTNVEPWTPPNGTLYQQHIVPLLPFTFKAALWDQGEADAKRTSSDYYATEFPKLVLGWREVFEVPGLSFHYVELCTEYGAEAPKEDDFWMAQRAAVTKLPGVGFATTTDIERALHPPDKQDVAKRLLLSVQRLAFGMPVVSRGPEVVSMVTTTTAAPAPAAVATATTTVTSPAVVAPTASAGTSLTITFSNASLATHRGIYVGAGPCPPGGNLAFSQLAGGKAVVPLNFTISGATVTVACDPASGRVLVNSDRQASCFLYSAESGLPAPPVEVPCK